MILNHARLPVPPHPLNIFNDLQSYLFGWQTVLPFYYHYI